MIEKVGLFSGVKKIFKNVKSLVKGASGEAKKNSTIPIYAGKTDLVHKTISPEKDISIKGLLNNGYKTTRANSYFRMDSDTYRSFNFNDGNVESMDLIDMKNPTHSTMAIKEKNNIWRIANFDGNADGVFIHNASDSAIQNVTNYVFKGHNVIGQDEKAIQLKGFRDIQFSISKVDGSEI